MILLIFLMLPVKTTQFFKGEMFVSLPLPLERVSQTREILSPLPLERVSRTREILSPRTPNSHPFFKKGFQNLGHLVIIN